MVFTAGRNIPPTKSASSETLERLDQFKKAQENLILLGTPTDSDMTGALIRIEEFGRREPDSLTFKDPDEMRRVAKVAHAISDGYPRLAEVLSEHVRRTEEATTDSQVLTIMDQTLAVEAFVVAGMIQGIQREIQTSEGIEAVPPLAQTLDPTQSEEAIFQQYLIQHSAA